MISELQRGTEQYRQIVRKGSKIVCHRKSDLCFIITEQEIFFATSLQLFLIRPQEIPGNLWTRRYLLIKERAMKRRIRDLNELFIACREGIDIMPARIEWI